jgi:hypothetical protein
MSYKGVIKILCLTTFLILLFSIGCNSNNKSGKEKVQKHRDNIVNVSDKIIDIKPEILFGNSLFYIIDDILIINEISPKGEKGIHLFNKDNFKYLTSTGIIGKGPGEITNPGRLGIDRKNRLFWAPDNGKRIMYRFPLDSVSKNIMFKPTKSIKLNNEMFIERFGFLNDSIAIGKAVHVTSNSSFEMAMAKINFNTEIIERFGYESPEAIGKKSNSLFAISVENNFYVNCYTRIDLMTICDLKGNLLFNVYGPGWFDNEQNKKSFYFDVDVFGRNIIASYIGDSRLVVKGNISKGNSPSKFIVFDMQGNYLKTIETGFEFTRFCVDEENKRIIAYFTGREEPLGYFDISFLKEK